MADRLQLLETASVAILREEYDRLMFQFGADDQFIDGWAFHNATHGLDVAEAGVVGARFQVGRGFLPPEAVPLARIAGIFHDDVQVEPTQAALSPRREELSVEAAFRAMDSYGEAIGERIFTADDRSLVRGMILATKVRGFEDGQIVQNVSAGDLPGAVMADADLSGLGRRGFRRSLHLLVENEARAGRLVVPHLSNARDVRPDRAVVAERLRGDADLMRRQRFLLPVSDRIWPHKAGNAQMIDEAREQLGRGSISWPELYDQSGPARPEVGPGSQALHADVTRHLGGLAPAGSQFGHRLELPPAAAPSTATTPAAAVARNAAPATFLNR